MAKAKLVENRGLDEPYLTLTLSEREARAVSAVLAYVAGSDPCYRVMIALEEYTGDREEDWEKVAFYMDEENLESRLDDVTIRIEGEIGE